MNGASFLKHAVHLAICMASLSGATAHAQAYPSKPITLVALYSPGSAGDVIARAVAKGVNEGGKMNMVVENKDGASGHVGVSHILNSAPDGYTLMLGTTNIVINMFTQKVNYKISDFAPIGLVGIAPNALTITSAVESKSLSEFVALAKAKPGQLLMATGGPTGIGTFLAETFNRTAGVDIGLIPYKGSSLAIPDLLAGRIHAIFATTATGMPIVNQGKARILGVTGNKRLPALPEVPTFKEAGLSSLDFPSWFAVMGKAGIPAPAIALINAEMVKALQRQDVREQLDKYGVEVTTGSPADLKAFLQESTHNWDRATRDSSFRVR